MPQMNHDLLPYPAKTSDQGWRDSAAKNVPVWGQSPCPALPDEPPDISSPSTSIAYSMRRRQLFFVAAGPDFPVRNRGAQSAPPPGYGKQLIRIGWRAGGLCRRWLAGRRLRREGAMQRQRAQAHRQHRLDMLDNTLSQGLLRISIQARQHLIG